MKLLGIDYGRKRLGLAVCGPLRVACPLATITWSSRDEVIAALAEVIREHDIEKLVIGLPKNMDNSLGEMAHEAEQFATMLREHFALAVELWDERLTSWQAEQLLRTAGLSRWRRKRHRDSVAACLILQSYVDSS